MTSTDLSPFHLIVHLILTITFQSDIHYIDHSFSTILIPIEKYFQLPVHKAVLVHKYKTTQPTDIDEEIETEKKEGLSLVRRPAERNHRIQIKKV